MDLHIRVLILKATQKVRGGDQAPGAVHADAVEEARDDGAFAPVQADGGYLRTRNDLPTRRTVRGAIEHLSQRHQPVTAGRPVEAQTGVVMLVAGVYSSFQRRADQF